MLPVITVSRKNSAHMRLVHSNRSGYTGLCPSFDSPSEDVPDVSFRELRHSIVFAARAAHSALVYGIPHILLRRAFIKMIRAYARSIVAMVANLTRRIITVMQEKGHAMSEQKVLKSVLSFAARLPRTNAAVSIPAHGAFPCPTTVTLFNFRPKAFLQWRGCSHNIGTNRNMAQCKR